MIYNLKKVSLPEMIKALSKPSQFVRLTIEEQAQVKKCTVKMRSSLVGDRRDYIISVYNHYVIEKRSKSDNRSVTIN